MGTISSAVIWAKARRGRVKIYLAGGALGRVSSAVVMSEQKQRYSYFRPVRFAPLKRNARPER